MNTIETKAVVSRILTEDVISLNEARSLIHQSTGVRPEKSTLTRWVHRGVGGVKLEAVRVGSCILTSQQAITRFIEARTKSL